MTEIMGQWKSDPLLVTQGFELARFHYNALS